MPNSNSEDNEQVTLYLPHDLIMLIDHEAGQMDLSRSKFCKRGLSEYLARLHVSEVVERLSQEQYQKSK